MRVLFASPVFCYPADNGTKKVNLDVVRHLIRSGHTVTYLYPALAQNANPEGLLEKFPHGLKLVSSRRSNLSLQRLSESFRSRFLGPFGVNANSYLAPADLRREVAQADAVIADYWVVARDLPRNTAKPVLLKINDISWPRVHDMFDVPAWRRYPTAAAFKWCEMHVFKRAETLFSASFHEAQALNATGFKALHIPVAIDLDVFKPQASENGYVHAALFVASNNKVNTLALQWVCERVAPLLQRTVPDFQFHILLNKPSETLQHYCEQFDFVTRHDWVDDLVGFYNRFPVVLLPFHNTTGVKIKLIEALACGRAVVSTQNGLLGTEAQQNRDALIADSDVEFARSIERVFSDGQLRRSLEEHARRYAENHHDLQAAFKPLDHWLESR